MHRIEKCEETDLIRLKADVITEERKWVPWESSKVGNDLMFWISLVPVLWKQNEDVVQWRFVSSPCEWKLSDLWPSTSLNYFIIKRKEKKQIISLYIIVVCCLSKYTTLATWHQAKLSPSLKSKHITFFHVHNERYITFKIKSWKN